MSTRLMEQSDILPEHPRSGSSWPPAAEAPLYQEVRNHLAGRGHDPQVFDELMFAISGLPGMRAHGPALAELRNVLNGAAFRSAGEWAHGTDWPKRIPAWRRLLQCWDTVREHFASRRNGSALDPVPRRRGPKALPHQRQHPMHGYGMTVAPLAAVLLVEHEFACAQDDADRAIAQKFRLLQESMVAACVHLNWRSGRTVAEYLVHRSEGVHEFPGRPRVDAACRAVRWLSHAKQASLLETCPGDIVEMRDYASRVTSWSEDRAVCLGGEGAKRVEAGYLQSLSAIFELFRQSLREDYIATTRSRSSQAAARFVSHVNAVDGNIPLQQGLPVSSTPAIPVPMERSKSARSGLSVGADPPSGLAPSDVDSPRLELVDERDIRRALSSAKWKAMSAAQADVVLPWDLRRLSPQQARTVAEHALLAIDQAITSGADERDATGAMLCLLTMTTGQPPADLSRLRVAGVRHARTGHDHGPRSVPTLRQWVQDVIDAPVLLVDASPGGPGRSVAAESSMPAVVGVLVPALMPRLASADDVPKIGVSGRSMRNLLLPAGSLGQVVLHWHLGGVGGDRAATVRSGSGERVFAGRVDPDRAERAVLDFLGKLPPPPGHQAWRVGLVQDHLMDWIEAKTGDRTRAWMATARQSAASQARVYYTQYSIENLSRAWLGGLVDGGLSALAGVHELGDSQSPGKPCAWPAGWPELEEIRRLPVGAPFVAPVAEVVRLVAKLRGLATAPVSMHRRSSLREHHHAILLHTLVLQGLCTGVRAVRSPVALARAVEQHDRVLAAAGLGLDETAVYAGLADKETYYNQNARLVRLVPMLVRQLRILAHHNERMMLALDRTAAWRASPRSIRAMFRLDERDQPVEVDVAWFKGELERLGFGWPANFSRAFLRTRLLERGTAAADIDALLGHRSPGAGAIGLHATLDFRASFERLDEQLNALHEELGLTVVDSALVASLPTSPPREILLAPLHRAGPIGRGRSPQPRQQGRPAHLTDFWQAIHRVATDDDRRQVRVLLRMLRFWGHAGNRFAQVLASSDPVRLAQSHLRLAARHEPSVGTGSDAGATPPALCDLALARGVEQVVASVVRLVEDGTRARFPLAASWLRLIMRACRALRAHGVELPPTKLVAFVRAPSSPFRENSVLVLPIVDGWRRAIRNWMKRAFDDARGWSASETGTGAAVASVLPEPPSAHSAEGWATALVMSAAVNGMLLEVTQLSMLLRRFCDPDGRRLPLATSAHRAHLDFRVPASGSLERRTRRWWIDPVTEAIWLHAPRMPRSFRLGELHPWLRRIALQAFPGSATTTYEPHSFGDLVRCAEIWWLARASRATVAMCRGQVDASSILTTCAGRLLGARQLRAPPFATWPERAPDADVRGRARVTLAPDYSSLAQLDFDANRSVEPDEARDDSHTEDDDLLASLHAALPWLDDVSAKLGQAAPGSVLVARAQLAAALPPDATSLDELLVNFAAWLADPAGAGFSGPTLQRTFNAAAHALLVLMNVDRAEDVTKERIAGLIASLGESTLRSGPTERSLAEALRRLARYLGVEDEVVARVAESDDDGPDEQFVRKQADARVLDHDEYRIAMDALSDDPDAQNAKLGTAARLLVMSSFRLGLRPGEVHGLRLCDAQALHFHALPYPGNPLKSRNAIRRVPTILLGDEEERWQNYLGRRSERDADPAVPLLTAGSRTLERARLDGIVRRVLRGVTADPVVRPYHLRHSLATWMDLALRAVDHPELLNVFQDRKRTHEWLTRGRELARELFGSEAAALGRTSYVISRVLGHIGPAVTVAHYQHGGDLIADAVVRREALSVDDLEWARMLGTDPNARPNASRSEKDLRRRIVDMRSRLGWHVAPIALTASPAGTQSRLVPARGGRMPVSLAAARMAARKAAMVADASGDDAALAGWERVVQVLDASQPVARGERAQADVARSRGIEEDELADWIDRLRAGLPRVAQPGAAHSAQAYAGIVDLVVADDVKLALGRFVAAMTALTGGKSSREAMDDLDFLIGCYDRRDRAFFAASSRDMQRLSALLDRGGLAVGSALVVVRSADPAASNPRLPDWASRQDLGAYSRSEVVAVRVRSQAKAASYARWMGLKPRGRTGEGYGQALAVVCVVAQALLGTC